MPTPYRTAFVAACLLGSLLVSTADSATAQEPPPITAGRASPPGTYGAIDVVHYDLDITLPDPGGRRIEGRATLRLRPTRAGVGAAVLDFTGLEVTGVTVDGDPVEDAYAAGRLSVPLSADAMPTDTFVVTIRYQGVPDDGLLLENNLDGEPAVFADNWPNRARFWFPSVDDPSDKATVSFTVHAPAAWVVVANGEQVGAPASEAAGNGHGPRRVWRWRLDEPVSSYNMVFGAGDLVEIPLGTAACGHAPASPRPDGCVEVSAWLFPEDTVQAHRTFLRAPEIVDYYTQLIGPYPYEKLAHVQSATRFGGMENASAIFYTDQGLASGRNLEGTVAHETAHQWFGDWVTEADWPELWLSEGFATYFGHLFFEHADGEKAFRALMEDDRQEYLASEVTGRPVIDRDQQDLFALLNDNSYQKGGWVLHMLRGILGDDVFFRGIRTYYERYGASNATSDDLRSVMEEVSGKDLAWFFHQWLEEPGYPVLKTDWSYDSGAGTLNLTVTQTQRADWPTFRLPLDVEVVPSSGAPERHRVELRQRVEHLSFEAPTAPKAVARDPDGWVLTGGPPLGSGR
ncbi:MAG: M1 family peptidase [Gemmatimonadetes bacterium]|nr:M1 family peptidase [Gemmatimonadota bacterium]